ncbi:hypothetical protein HK101_009911 [Irineochytrium annulatum]|nr:hypothetical protein HK101_009911 [Irineochytrium annulatum]
MEPEPELLDVTEDGVEIEERLLTAPERFWDRLRFVNVADLRKAGDAANKSNGDSSDHMDVLQTQQQPPPQQHRPPPINLMKDRIYYAREEIRLAIDIMNRVTEKNPDGSDVNDPKMLTPEQQMQQQAMLNAGGRIAIATMNKVPTHSKAKQIANLQLIMASKKQHLLGVTSRLKTAAKRLEVILDKEGQFYSHLAMSLRKNNWILQSRDTDHGRELHVGYGLRGAGSSSREACDATLLRNTSSSITKDFKLQMAHRRLKTVDVMSGHSDTSVRGNGAHAVADASTTGEEVDSGPSVWFPCNYTAEGASWRQLAMGQLSAFETELFTVVSQEATAMKSDLTISSNSVRVNSLTPTLEFKLNDWTPTPATLTPPPPTASEALWSARFQTLLARRNLRRIHRYNRQRFEHIGVAVRRAGCDPASFQLRVLFHSIRWATLGTLRTAVRDVVTGAVRDLKKTQAVGEVEVRTAFRVGEVEWGVWVDGRWVFKVHLSSSGELGFQNRESEAQRARHGAEDVAKLQDFIAINVRKILAK